MNGLKLNDSHTTILDTFQVFALTVMKLLYQKFPTVRHRVMSYQLGDAKIVLTNASDYFIALIILTLQTGYFPNQFKQGVLRPLIKKFNLDPELLSSYRPVTNLRFLSKFVERVVWSKLICIWNLIISGASIKVFFVARIQRKRLY